MKAYLEVYGCTANKSDASLVEGLLQEHHHELVKDKDDADVLVLLTCTVIGTTEQRMLSRLRKLKETGKQIIVTGCMASVQVELITSIVPDAKLLQPQHIYHIIDLLDDKKVSFTEKNKTLFSKHFNGLTAPISIAEGCLFSCSYCITSIARGKLKSYPIDEIVQDVHSALGQGCKEIQLTAQDTGSYGLDTNHNLGELLTNVCKINGNYRIRVGMMNPYTALKTLDTIIKGFDNSKIYKFLHLPVQSGDNEILHKMNRKYTVDDFIEIINRFRKCYHDITLSTDIIVGFPGESEEQFERSVKLIKKVKPDIVNITRFSARPMTKAKTMKGRIPTEIVKERSKRLTEVCSRMCLENNQKHVGKKYTTLVIKKGKKDTVAGRTENYRPVVMTEKVELGTFIPTIITDATSTHLVGRII